MITARNYAAQAERGFVERAKKMDMDGRFQHDPKIYLSAAEIIRKSVHFVVPDGGVLLSDNFKGIRGIEIRLPYPSITVEYYIENNPLLPPGRAHSFKKVIIAQQLKDEIAIVGGWYLFGFWWLSDVAVIVPSCWDDVVTKETGHDRSKDIFTDEEMKGGTKLAINRVVTLLPDSFKMKSTEVGKKEATNCCYRDMAEELGVIFSLIEALSCKNVETKIFQQDVIRKQLKSNGKRIKKGKLPFYETKMLVINTGETKPGQQGSSSGTHASPRQHLRRGHIRRLSSGNIWVNSCVVGDPSKGKISKSYEVR